MDATYSYVQASHAIVERTPAMADVGRRFGTTLPAAAIQFTLRHAPSPASSSVCSAAEVSANAAYFCASPPAALWEELDGVSEIKRRRETKSRKSVGMLQRTHSFVRVTRIERAAALIRAPNRAHAERFGRRVGADQQR